MKHLFCLLLFSLSMGVFAQTIEPYTDGENYYLATTTTSDNGTDISDTIRTISYLGDTSNYVQALRDIDASQTNQNVRMLIRLQALSYAAQDKALTDAALEIGVDLDSINNAVYADDLMIDTMKMIVFMNRISETDAALWTLDPNAPNRLVLDVEVVRRNNGNLILEAGIAGNQRVQMESTRLFSVTNLPGASALYLESENDRTRIWRSDNIGPPTIQLISYKEARDRSANELKQ